jgi:DNA-binding transcriptional LysR family regulator
MAMNRLESMGVLLAVVEAGSLSAAGRKLGMPLATVSRRLSELEAALKSRLLIRSTRQMTLTEAGRGYVEACRRILEDVSEAERAAAGEYAAPRGELIVTAPVVLGRLHLLPVLGEFLQAYPEVKVRLLLGDRNINLLEGHLDLALRVGTISSGGLVATPLGSVRKVLCASPSYLARKGAPQRVQELTAHDCVSFDLFAVGDAWHFPGAGADVVVPIQPRLTASNAETAIAAAVAGLGITCVLSYQIEGLVRAGKLVVLLKSFEPAPLPVNFLYASQGRLPLKLRALLDFAIPPLRARLRDAATALPPTV